MSDDITPLVERVTRALRERLGKAPPDLVRAVVSEVARDMERSQSGTSRSGSARPAREEPQRHLPLYQAQAVAPMTSQAAPHTTPRGSAMPMPPPAEGQPPLDYCALCVEQEKDRGQQRAILTTTGRNRRGIVARVTQSIADAGGDILDISQTLVSDYFTMILVIDLRHLEMPFADFKERVLGACRDLDLQAMIMHEDVARSLQRL
jgi:ACT domain-containing protein